MSWSRWRAATSNAVTSWCSSRRSSSTTARPPQRRHRDSTSAFGGGERRASPASGSTTSSSVSVNTSDSGECRPGGHRDGDAHRRTGTGTTVAATPSPARRWSTGLNARRAPGSSASSCTSDATLAPPPTGNIQSSIEGAQCRRAGRGHDPCRQPDDPVQEGRGRRAARA